MSLGEEDTMTKAQAIEIFCSEVLPHVIVRYGEDDIVIAKVNW